MPDAASMMSSLLWPARLFAVALPWYIAAQLAALLALPVAFGLVTRLPDRGYAASKGLGLLLLTFVTFVFSHMESLGGVELGFSRQSILLAVVFLWIIGTVGLVRSWGAMAAFLRARWRLLLGMEALYAAAFLAMLTLRAEVPQITYVINDSAAEKFTDFAVLNGLLASKVFPPQDAWVAGAPMNYYYFGHLMWAVLARLTSTPPEIAFNLALATIFGLVAVLSFSLGFNATGKWKFGLLAAFLITLSSNLDGAMQLAVIVKEWFVEGRHEIPWYGAYSYWRSSRAIENTINEFPAFSFILGDLHAHLSSFVLYLTGLTLALEMARGLAGTTSLLRYETDHLPILTVFALLLGGMSAANSWDALTMSGVFVAMAWAVSCRGAGMLTALGRAGELLLLAGVLLLVGARLFFHQFHAVFRPPVSMNVDWQAVWPFFRVVESPIGLVDPLNRSLPAEFLIHWVLLLGAPVALLAGVARRWWREGTGLPPDAARDHRERRLACAAVAAALLALLVVALQGWVAAVLVTGAVLLGLAVAAKRLPPRIAEIAGLLLAFCALATICEVVYIDDVFEGPTERINTVFKVYYGLWPVAALAAVMALRRQTDGAWGGRGVAVAWTAALVLLGGVYPVMGTLVRVAGTTPQPPPATAAEALDGMRYLATLHPGDYAAIQWLRAHAEPSEIVLEAAGTQYTYAGRVSTNTGMPAVGGWLTHGRSWRGESFDGQVRARTADVMEIYLTADPARAYELLVNYGVRYIVIGDAEREAYPALFAGKFDAIAEPVFTGGETTVYRVREQVVFPPAPVAPEGTL